MESVSQTYVKEEAEGQFIIYFLNKDEGQSVHVEEADQIDLSEVIQHVNLGGSVFITQRRKPSLNISSRKASIVKKFEEIKKLRHFVLI